MVNSIKEKLKNNKTVSGCFIGMYSTYLAEISGYLGFDFVLIDNEHGAFSWGEVENMIRAIDITGSTPMVRVPNSDPINILKALDRGAQGIQVPQVETAEEVEKIIKATKYPPDGNRGAAFSVRAAKYGLKGGYNYLKQSNRDIFISIQLETPQAINNVDSIMKKDIDMVYIGPTDLSVAMGEVEKGANHSEVRKLIDKVFQSGKENNKNVGIHVNNASEWREREGWGASYMGIAINAIINPAMQNFINEIKK